MKRFSSIFLFAYVIILLNACNYSPSINEDKTILYTSIYPVQFIVEELVQDEAEVISVYPPGVDAHSYEPTTREMLDIAKGKAFIYLGAGMESFAESAQAALQASDVKFVELGKHEYLFLEDEGHDSHDHHDIDPHIWFDPLRMIQASEIIRDELTKILPEHTNLLKSNFDKLSEQLLGLDKQYEDTLSSKQNRHILVSHGAYQYWEDRYGIIQIPISGLSPGDEPSQKELANLVTFAENQNIKYVLFEKNATNKIAEIIQENISAKPLYIHNLEVLVDEDLTKQKNYFTIMQENLENLDRATE